ncbi:hypothetical protein DL765_002576 [Monosporascus sp. GIB2]|nr:hypothetical protein DL765_002576 [Monosporascus sp. GIB2]
MGSQLCGAPAFQTRDSIEDIWGPRTPYKHEWPPREDRACNEEPEKWVQSACVLCSNGCGLDIGVKDGKVVGVRGRVTDRVNKGRLGPKGLHGWDSMNQSDRLTKPLIRKNGKLEPASWDEAMGLIVEKSRKLAKYLTNHSIAFYTSGQLFLEEYYALAVIGKAGLHTLHMDGNTRLCTATAAASMRESFGSDGQPGSYGDIDYTDCIFLVGHNMAATQTVLWARVLDRLHGPDPPKLIVVDPRNSATAQKATVHLAPKIGTNLALLNGIQHLLFENGWINEDYVSKHTVGVEELRGTAQKYTPEYVEEITGVPVEQLKEAARILGTTKSLLSTALQGVYQSNQATASACQINNISLLRGLIGKPGSGILQMNGQPTAQNNREAGCDGEFPGFRNHLNPDHMNELARMWNIAPIRVPHWNEPTHVENLLKYIADGSIRMLWISATNPLVSLPTLARVRELLTQPELFVVCQDIYMTETAAVADVVLPAAQWAEKTGCFTNVDRTVHLSHKAVDPPGEAKSDLAIFLDYGRRMGFRDRDGNDLLPWATPEEVFEAWKKLSAGRPCDYTGLTYEKLTGGSGIQWPCNEANPQGTERLFADGHFFTDIDYCESFGHDLETGAPFSKEDYKKFNPAGRAILKSCHYNPPIEATDEEYPLMLSTGRKALHFHTRTKTGRTLLQKSCPEPAIRISKEDAARFGVEDNEMVIVRSKRGAVEMKALVGGVSPGRRLCPFTSDTGIPKTAERKRPMNLRWARAQQQVQVREQQSQAVAQVSSKDAARTISDNDLTNRRRRLVTWMGNTHETMVQLIDIYEHLIPKLIDDYEVEAGLQVLLRIARGMESKFKPQADKFGEDAAEGLHRAEVLKESLFPREDSRHTEYEVLDALQGLEMYLGYIASCLNALQPVSQAVWDEEFCAVVSDNMRDLRRMQAWVRKQIKVRAPQTLLVPALPGGDYIRDIAREQRRRKSPTNGQERVPITEGVGRIAACDHASPLSTPEFDSSAMDGFAIPSARTLYASPETPASFRVRGIVAAGEEPPTIRGCITDDFPPAVEIMTGAKFPAHEAPGESFDACVKYEDTWYCPERKGVISVSKPVPRNANRRFAGEDIARGDVVLEAGQAIETTHVMPLASVAVDSVLVVKRPSVGVLSTGKELVSGQATVRDVNGPFLTAACQEAGASASFLDTLTDDPEILTNELAEITRRCEYDVLVSSGAVSAGKYDFVRTALAAIGAEVVFHGLAIPKSG